MGLYTITAYQMGTDVATILDCPAELKMAKNKTSRLTLKVYDNCAGYGQLMERKTLVELKRGSEILFYGRVLKVNDAMDSNGIFYNEVTCAGEFDFLRDVALLDDGGITHTVGDYSNRLSQLLVAYNDRGECSYYIQYAFGQVSPPITDGDSTVYDEISEGYESAQDNILAMLDYVGGEMRFVAYGEGMHKTIYVYWADSLGDTIPPSTLAINLASSIESYQAQSDVSDICTRLWVYGSMRSDGTRYQYGPLILSGMGSYGNVEKSILDEDLSSDIDCMKYAQRIKSDYDTVEISVKVSVAELAAAGLSDTFLRLLNKYTVTSSESGFSQVLELTELTISTDDPLWGDVVFGDKSVTLAEMVAIEKTRAATQGNKNSASAQAAAQAANAANTAAQAAQATADGAQSAADAAQGDIDIVAGALALDEANIGILNANVATIQQLYAKTADVNTLLADYVKTSKLEANYLTAANINATFATIATLQAGYLTADNINATFATIANLTAESTRVNTLLANKITTGDLITDSLASITIDATKYITGVTIVGDVIKANTISASKILLTSPDSNDSVLLTLNALSKGVDVSELDKSTYGSALDGSIIVADSITADKITVADLKAFGATIAGWTIEDGQLSSGAASGFVALNSSASNDYLLWAGAVSGENAKTAILKNGDAVLSDIVGTNISITPKTSGAYRYSALKLNGRNADGTVADGLSLNAAYGAYSSVRASFLALRYENILDIWPYSGSGPQIKMGVQTGVCTGITISTDSDNSDISITSGSGKIKLGSSSTLVANAEQLEVYYNSVISGKVRLTNSVTVDGELNAAGGTLTGELYAPTATTGTKNTQVATTAFVHNALAPSWGSKSWYTNAVSDGGTYIRYVDGIVFFNVKLITNCAITNADVGTGITPKPSNNAQIVVVDSTATNAGGGGAVSVGYISTNGVVHLSGSYPTGHTLWLFGTYVV